MMQYVKMALVVVAVMAIVNRVPALSGIVSGK